MFLELYEMRRLRYTSQCVRDSNFFHTNLNTNSKFRHLVINKKWNAGRNDSGKIVFRTKTSLLKKFSTYKINYNYRYLRLGFVASFNFIPWNNKIISLIIFSNGLFSYFTSGERFRLFSIFFFNKKKITRRFNFKNFHLMLIQIKKLSFVSCLEIVPGGGSQYSRSTGVQSKIIKFDNETHSVLVQLPSGVKKNFSFYSFVLFDRVANSINKKFLNGKAGYWRSFGFNSVVRGVAKNPVDHPHGGRTKSIKYPRTPWGKTTKFK